MAQDSATKWAIGIVVLLAIIGVVVLMRSGGYQYKLAGRESPGQVSAAGECCTCTRAEQTLQGAVKPETRQVLFRNVRVGDCVAECARVHDYTKRPYVNYDVNAFVGSDEQCRESLPEPRTYPGAGGFNDQPLQDQYYITS